MSNAHRISDRLSRLAAVLGSLLAVSACHADAVAPAAATGHAATYVSPGKRQAPLGVSWRLAGKPEVGQPLTIDLGIVPAAPAGHIELSIQAGRGLEPGRGLGTLALGTMKAGEVASHSVTVTPLVEGALFVNVIAVMQTDGGPQMKTFAVPVNVGDPAFGKASAAIEVDAQGEPVVVLPAEESTGN